MKTLPALPAPLLPPLQSIASLGTHAVSISEKQRLADALCQAYQSTYLRGIGVPRASDLHNTQFQRFPDDRRQAVVIYLHPDDSSTSTGYCVLTAPSALMDEIEVKAKEYAAAYASTPLLEIPNEVFSHIAQYLTNTADLAKLSSASRGIRARTLADPALSRRLKGAELIHRIHNLWKAAAPIASFNQIVGDALRDEPKRGDPRLRDKGLADLVFAALSPAPGNRLGNPPISEVRAADRENGTKVALKGLVRLIKVLPPHPQLEVIENNQFWNLMRSDLVPVDKCLLTYQHFVTMLGGLKDENLKARGSVALAQNFGNGIDDISPDKWEAMGHSLVDLAGSLADPLLQRKAAQAFTSVWSFACYKYRANPGREIQQNAQRLGEKVQGLFQRNGITTYAKGMQLLPAPWRNPE